MLKSLLLIFMWELVLSKGQHSWCPRPSQITPCTCGGAPTFTLLTCERVLYQTDLQRSFQAYFPEKRMGKFSLINSEITILERGVIRVSFEYIHIQKTNIRVIESGALDTSASRAKRIEIIHNDVEKFPFKNIKRFTELEYLILQYNEIKSVPDEALKEHNKLVKIDLSFNKISYVGSNAFQNMLALESLDLRYNKLTVLNNMAFSSLWHHPLYKIDLSNNNILKIADDAFKSVVPSVLNMTNNQMKDFAERPFYEMLNRMANKGTGLIMVTQNRFRCSCEGLRWLVELAWNSKRHVVGFQCTDNKRPLEELTLPDIGCSSY